MPDPGEDFMAGYRASLRDCLALINPDSYPDASEGQRALLSELHQRLRLAGAGRLIAVQEERRGLPR